MITVEESFPNWLYVEFMAKKENGDALFLSADFATR